jgi:GT2 family glycosyltransferase
MNIVVSTLGSPALEILKASVKVYAPECVLTVFEGREGSFGADYNRAMAEAFETADEILIANDDIVLTPTTLKVLMEDVATLKRDGIKIGSVGVRSDSVRPHQHIAQNNGGQMLEVAVISPILAYIPKQAFEASRFPPLNWYSDDVWCIDLKRQGFRHFVSRAYVHHAGSTTIGHDNQKLHDDAKPWIIANRPEYATYWGMA